jgi:LemA protein
MLINMNNIIIFMIGIIISIVVAVIVLGYLFGTYNRFINLKNGIESTQKQINVALKKRLDLISQIVSSVKGQMKFEKGTLTEVTKMRAGIKPETSIEDAKKIDAASRKILSGIQVQVEAYPNLKSNENVSQLINAVNTTEDEIARLRYTFNNTIQEYNTKTQMIPSNIVAGIFGFGKNKYLEFSESEAELNKTPKIDL